LARFGLLLSRDKSSYPFRGMSVDVLITVNLEDKTSSFARTPWLLSSSFRRLETIKIKGTKKESRPLFAVLCNP
jgi:hypothetical protein